MDESSQSRDENSRGIGLLFRVAGALVPLVLGILFIIAWRSMGLGLMAGLAAVFVGLLLWRRDRRGAIAIGIWLLIWALLLAEMTSHPD